jgi:hypothetical protein
MLIIYGFAVIGFAVVVALVVGLFFLGIVVESVHLTFVTERQKRVDSENAAPFAVQGEKHDRPSEMSL